MEEKQIFGYVYMVKNLVNGKMYFGITENDFNIRYGGNIGKHTHNEHLKRSIKEYGIENFEINEQFDVAYNEDDLYDLEDMYMCIYNTLDPKYGYNKKRSGSKHKGNGKLNTQTKKKMSESHKGKPRKPHTEETKQKMSESHKGKPRKPRSEETKQKMSESQKGKTKTEETKQKISESLKGRPSKKQKKIICLETLQIFDNATKAGEWCGVGRTAIKNHINGKKTSGTGKHPVTGEKLHWMYYSDYLKLQEEQQSNKTQDLATEVA